MRHRCCLAAFCLALTAQAPDPSVIRVKTQLVQINAVVSDGDGPMHGLTKADFALTTGGRPRDIVVFSEDTKAVHPDPGSFALPPQVFSNVTAADVPKNVSLVLFDTLNLEPGQSVYAQKQLVKFLRTVPQGEGIGIYLLAERLGIIHDFTSDTASLIAVAEALDGRQGSSTNKTRFTPVLTGMPELDRLINRGEIRQALRSGNDRVIVTVASLRQIARRLRNFPGRKNLIWITGGIPFSANFMSEIGSAGQELTQANVAIYPVDVRGPLPLRQELGSRRPRMDAWDANSMSMQALAEQTGGLALANTNDIAGAVQRALNDAASSYTIGFYLSPEEADGKFHDLKLRVNRKGAKVRTRSGYFALPEEEFTEARRLREIEVVMASPLHSYGIQVGGRADAYRENGQSMIGIRMLINPHQIRFESKAGKWEAHLDAFAELQSVDGKRIVRTMREGKLLLSDADRELLLTQGLDVPLVLPNDRNGAVLRLGVFDRKSGLAGSASRVWLAKP